MVRKYIEGVSDMTLRNDKTEALAALDRIVGKEERYTEDPETCQCDYHKACRAEDYI